MTPWRRHMFLCFCQLALAPLLGPYPRAYTASQLRSLRRAPGRLDHRPVHIVLEEDDGPQIVVLVEDEHGTEFMFSDAMPGTPGHSFTIGKIKAAIGDRGQIAVDAAGAFMHTPLPAAGAFAYLPPLPSAEGLAYLEQLQPVVGNLRAHGPVVIAQPPELSTNKPGKISSNLIKNRQL